MIPRQINEDSMRRVLLYTASALVIFTSGSASAREIVLSCECLGYAEQYDDIVGARNSAIRDCRLGAKSCAPESCPAGMIDVTPYDSAGRSLSVKMSEKDITKSLHNMTAAGSRTPSAGPCQRIVNGNFACSVAGAILRHCWR